MEAELAPLEDRGADSEGWSPRTRWFDPGLHPEVPGFDGADWSANKEFDRILLRRRAIRRCRANVFFRAIDWDLRTRSTLEIARRCSKMAALPV